MSQSKSLIVKETIGSITFTVLVEEQFTCFIMSDERQTNNALIIGFEPSIFQVGGEEKHFISEYVLTFHARSIILQLASNYSGMPIDQLYIEDINLSSFTVKPKKGLNFKNYKK